MLHIETKKHDQFTLEFKIGYSHGDRPVPVSDFVMNTWVFIPDSLYINAKTYSKSDFYRDTRSYIRLMTPIFSLHELIEEDCQPFVLLSEALTDYRHTYLPDDFRNLEHQLKMLGNIVRSALRSRSRALSQEKDDMRCLSLLEETFRDLETAQHRLRSLFADDADTVLGCVAFEAFRKTDAYLCSMIFYYLSRRVEELKTHHHMVSVQICALAQEYFDAATAYQQEKGYCFPEFRNKMRNQCFLKKISRLRRFVESDLYLQVRKKNNTFLLQQLLFMMAAGLSMIFATIISFSFQQTYGNFTRPLFIALVVSYMFKDRIKDFLRYWFSNKLGSKYYDYRTKLEMRGKYIGQGKEGFDFVNEGRIPKTVRRLRQEGEENEGVLSPESVLLYRRRMILWGQRLSRISRYAFSGVNEIVRINLKDFLRRMDNPYSEISVYQGKGEFQKNQVERLYELVVIVQFSYQKHTYYKRYRLLVNRRGLKQIQEW